MILLSILIQGGSTPTALERYRARTHSAVVCHATADSADIVVCGRRKADRYRLPFIVYELGDPRHMGVPEERNRLIHDETPCEAKGPFLIGCGAVGVNATVDSSGARAGGGMRPLAP